MKHKIVRIVFGVLGVGILLTSAMFLAVFATEFITGDTKTQQSTLIGLVVFFTGTLYGGFRMAQSCFGWGLPRFHMPGKRRREREQAVLSYVTSVGGRVTVIEVAGRCGLSLDESKEILDHFAAHQVAELLVTDEGDVIYDFDILSPREKARAKDVL